MCSSLDGSQNRAMVRIAATVPQDTSSRPGSISRRAIRRAQHPPQAPGQPDVAEVPQPFELHAAQSHLHQLRSARRRPVHAADRTATTAAAACVRSPSRCDPAWPSRSPRLRLQLAQIRHHPLPRSLRRAIRFDQRPIGVASCRSFVRSHRRRNMERSFTRTTRRIAQQLANSRTRSSLHRLSPLPLHQHWTYV